MKRKGIIDLGTNTFHLLIVEKKEGKLKTLHYEYQAVRLGEGGIQKNELTKEAIERGLKTLCNFKTILNQYEVTNITAIGTSALRNAKNSDDFVQSVVEKTGIEIAIISGEKEAQLIYEGVIYGVSLSEKNHLIMDIGGGSVEFIICNQEGILWKKSVEIGGQRLMQLFHQEDPISLTAIEKLETYLEDQLIDVQNALAKYSPTILIGASGAFDTLCEIYTKQFTTDNYENFSSYELPMNHFWKITNELIEQKEEVRKNMIGMIPLRVKMIVVASILIQYIVKKQAIEQLICTNYALKEGVAWHFLEEN